jgi:hypothetical protein
MPLGMIGWHIPVRRYYSFIFDALAPLPSRHVYGFAIQLLIRSQPAHSPLPSRRPVYVAHSNRSIQFYRCGSNHPAVPPARATADSTSSASTDVKCQM